MNMPPEEKRRRDREAARRRRAKADPAALAAARVEADRRYRESHREQINATRRAYWATVKDDVNAVRRERRRSA